LPVVVPVSEPVVDVVTSLPVLASFPVVPGLLLHPAIGKAKHARGTERAAIEAAI
jgi:hypothetical protein